MRCFNARNFYHSGLIYRAAIKLSSVWIFPSLAISYLSLTVMLTKLQSLSKPKPNVTFIHHPQEQQKQREQTGLRCLGNSY